MIGKTRNRGSITFLHFGENKCPKCGIIGNKKTEDDIKFFECPCCHMEFTNEIVLYPGEYVEEGFPLNQNN